MGVPQAQPHLAVASVEVVHDCPPDRCTARPPDRVERQLLLPQFTGHARCSLSNDSYIRSYQLHTPRWRATLNDHYTTPRLLEQLVDQLSERDQAILLDLAKVRMLTGNQLTRLHFAELSADNRERTRRRVLARLVKLQLAVTLDRTIGGARAGSAGHVYSLGIVGKRALPLLWGSTHGDRLNTRHRAPWTPGTLFLSHSLAIAELYVALREFERIGQLALAQFAVESAAWHPDGQGGLIKPDAYVCIQAGEIEDCWWCEVDRATESIPTLKRKLLSYVDFARAGQLGPDGIMPRVLLTVPHDHRLSAVRKIIEGLPAPGEQLILTTLHDQASEAMIDILRS
jgi:Replication-relaxation